MKRLILFGFMLLALAGFSQTFKQHLEVPSYYTRFGTDLAAGQWVYKTGDTLFYILRTPIPAFRNINWVIKDTSRYYVIGGTTGGGGTGTTMFTQSNSVIEPSPDTDTLTAKTFYVGFNGIKYDAPGNKIMGGNGPAIYMYSDYAGNRTNMWQLGPQIGTFKQEKTTEEWGVEHNMYGWSPEYGPSFKWDVYTWPEGPGVGLKKIRSVLMDSMYFYNPNNGDNTIHLGHPSYPWDTSFTDFASANEFSFGLPTGQMRSSMYSYTPGVWYFGITNDNDIWNTPLLLSSQRGSTMIALEAYAEKYGTEWWRRSRIEMYADTVPNAGGPMIRFLLAGEAGGIWSRSLFYDSLALYPNTDKQLSLGKADHRWDSAYVNTLTATDYVRITSGDTTTAVAVEGKIVYDYNLQHFFGCRSTDPGKKWYQLDN